MVPHLQITWVYLGLCLTRVPLPRDLIKTDPSRISPAQNKIYQIHSIREVRIQELTKGITRNDRFQENDVLNLNKRTPVKVLERETALRGKREINSYKGIEKGRKKEDKKRNVLDHVKTNFCRAKNNKIKRQMPLMGKIPVAYLSIGCKL